jgi:hypothetical protein
MVLSRSKKDDDQRLLRAIYDTAFFGVRLPGLSKAVAIWSVRTWQGPLILYAPAVRDARFVTIDQHPRHGTVVVGQVIGERVAKPDMLAVPLLERPECVAAEARYRNDAMWSAYALHSSQLAYSLDLWSSGGA